MFCKKCGTEQKPGQKFCPKCGTPYKVVIDNGSSYVKTNEEERVTGTSEVFTEEKYEEPIAHRSPSVSSKKTPIRIISAMIALAVIAIGGLLGWKYLKSHDVDLFTSNTTTSDIEGIPFKSSEKGKWGMLRPDGSILFEDEFKDMPTVARNGRFMVRNGNGLWEIFTATENPEKVGDEYVSIGDFYNGVAPAVRRNEQISLIDKDGNVIAVLDKSGSKSITRMENFHYGYALFEADDAVGIVNTKGDILLEAKKYCKIYHVAPKRFLALDMKYMDEEDAQNYVYDVIDPVGEIQGRIRMSKYSGIAVLDDGYIGIEQTSDGDKLYGIMNLEGEVIVKPTSKIQGLTGLHDGKYIFSDGEGLGIRTINNEVLIRAKYDAIVWATDDLLWVNSLTEGRQSWSLVDLEGKRVSKDTYQYALPFYNGKNAFVQITDKTWGVIDSKGDEMKNTPDIYIVTYNTADEVIKSDYVDMDAIVSAIKMTPNGFGGFGTNMLPLELLRVYNENCEEGDRLELNPDKVHTDRLAYTKEVLKGVDLSVDLYYSQYITEREESHFDESIGEWIEAPYKWTKETPQYVRMSVSGSSLAGKTKLLYRKLLAKAKTYGVVYKENDNACIVVRKNNKGIVLVNTGSEVWAMVKSMDSLRNEDIEQYSDIETRKGAGYVYDEEPVDTLVVDTTAFVAE